MFSSPPAVEDSGEAAGPVTSSKVLLCEPLANAPGKSITAQLVDFPPMAYTAARSHSASVTALILKSTIRLQMTGMSPRDCQFGKAFFEPPRALHLFADNPGPEHPAKLLATYVTGENRDYDPIAVTGRVLIATLFLISDFADALTERSPSISETYRLNVCGRHLLSTSH